MHELGIATELVELACSAARQAGACAVDRVFCRVGALRQVEPDLLREAFAAARSGTLCDRADLSVETLPLRARCPDCRTEFAVAGWDWHCPCCGTDGDLLSQGDELELVSIEAQVGP